MKWEGKTDEMVASSAASEDSRIVPVSVQVEARGGRKSYHAFRYPNSRGGEAFLSIGRVSCLLREKRHQMMMDQVSSSRNGRYSGMKGFQL